MRSQERLLEVIKTLNNKGVGSEAYLSLNMAFDIITGACKAQEMPGLLLARIAEVHSSPNVCELATEALHYIRAGAMRDAKTEDLPMLLMSTEYVAWRAEIERLRGLAAEIERLRAALTPSADTKAAYSGEFRFTEEAWDEDDVPYDRKITVPWTTIKEIMAAILLHAASGETSNG